MGPHDKERLEARYFACTCFWQNWGDLSEAVRQFEAEWNADREHPISDVRSFIKYWKDNFKNHYTVLDAGGQGRPKIMPDDAVAEIAKIIAAGYDVQRSFEDEGQQHEYIEHLRFASLQEAIAHSPRIQELQRQHPAKGDDTAQAKYLLRRLHEVVPSLTYGRLHMKAPLSPDDKQWRAEYAAELLAWLEEEPDVLEDFFWVDECSVWLNKHECGKLMVWYDTHDMNGTPPTENVFVSRKESMKLEIILIVSARHGCVWVEFLTGTTDLEQDGYYNQSMRDNMEDRKRLGLGCYKVGAGQNRWKRNSVLCMYCAPSSLSLSQSMHVMPLPAASTAAYVLVSMMNLGYCRSMAACMIAPQLASLVCKRSMRTPSSHALQQHSRSSCSCLPGSLCSSFALRFSPSACIAVLLGMS